ncbi:MAG: NAD-dependent epimerase/dehydratase family protein [Oceanihabitans sp.]
MILVTGGTGLVGSHLLYKLVCTEQPIRAIYRDEKKVAAVKKVFSYYTKDALNYFNKIDWVKADILDIPSLYEAFAGVTKVYHCAAFISFNPKNYYQLRKVNIEGTANIVNFSIAHKIEKLCYVSSIATLGKKEDKSFIDEKTDWNPESNNSVYGITKYGAEMEVWRGTQEGLNAVIVNPGIIIGAGYWKTGSGLFFKKTFKGLTYYTKGVTGYVSVQDVVFCMVKLMESNIANQRFVLVSNNLSFKAFIALIAANLKVKAPTKNATSFVLQLGWRLDWIRSFITRKPREFNKQQAQTALSITRYSSDKIENAIGVTFQPIEGCVKKVAKRFLKEM